MSSKRGIQRREAKRALVRKLSTKCHVCGKTAAASEEEAWELARKQFNRHGGEMPKRVYPCGDVVGNPWHWTRMEIAPSQPKAAPPMKRHVDMYSEEYWA